MPESHEAHLSVLTDAEKEAIERPGLKQRSKAILAATEFATKIGLSDDVTAALVDRLRKLDGKDDAKLAWQTLGDMNELLSMLNIDARLTVDAPDEDSTTGELAEQTVQSDGGEPAEMELETEDWFEGRQFDLRSVREFYKSIERKTQGDWITIPESAEQINPDEIIGLLALYGVNHSKPKVVAKQLEYLRENMLADAAQEGSYGGGVRYAATGKIAELLDSDSLWPDIKDKGSVEPLAASGEKVLNASLTLDNLIEQEGEEPSYNIERVERLLDQLRREGIDIGLTAEDFTHDVMKQLADIYSKATMSPEEMINTNIACTWGWLSSVDMEDLIHMRRSVKPDAGAADVHNSKASFINGVIKGWRMGLRLEPSANEIDSDSIGPLHSVPDLKHESDETTDPPEVRSMDEEPKHVQVVDAYIEQLDLSVNRRAFEELLNPTTRGEMTAAKTIVLEMLRRRVGDVSPTGEVLNELMVKARGKSALRRMLGLGFVKHGKPEERAPEALKDQLRNIPIFDHAGYANDFYDALEALLGVLVAEKAKAEKAPKPFQVVFGDDGEVSIA